jgi:hypothetical protein
MDNCEQLSISKITLYNCLRHRSVEIGTARNKKPEECSSYGDSFVLSVVEDTDFGVDMRHNC